jgi:hypothetical protein
VAHGRRRLAATLRFFSTVGDIFTAGAVAEHAYFVVSGELGAPAAAVYESKSGKVVEVFEDLKVNEKHSYAMVKQSLYDQVVVDEKDLEETKAGKPAATESKSSGEGELASTQASLNAMVEALATARSTWARVYADHETTVTARAEERKVTAETIGILKNTTSGAVGQSYSLLQVAAALGNRTRSVLARAEVLTFPRRPLPRLRACAEVVPAKRRAGVFEVPWWCVGSKGSGQ